MLRIYIIHIIVCIQDGLSIDKLEEQLNVLKSNFTEKQTLIEEMMAKCKVSAAMKCSLTFLPRPRTMGEGNPR